MKFNFYPEKLKKSISRELFIIILVLVFTFSLAFVTHLADYFDRIIHRHRGWLAGELIITSICFTVVSWIYAIKRRQEYKQSVGSLKQMQEATAMQGDREKCLEAGMDDYINKPVRSQELMNAFERCGHDKSHTQYRSDIATGGEPRVNLQRLFADLDKSDEDMRNILTLFEDDALRLLKNIELAVKAGRLAEVSIHLHTLRGQCGLVDMHTVNDIALQLQIHAANKQTSKVEQLLPRLSQELRESLGEMQITRTVNK